MIARSAPPARSLLRPLGIVGYDALEPALLAALATGEPLLLVSDHGAAKTLLLLRLAEALQLELRHYNASLLQFDDLAGFPIPDERSGSIRYAAPPGAIWGAHAVFFDEIGRCRPEAANKLFPIIHERKLQGIALDQLRYRWAATNPPPEAADEGTDATDHYAGVELLDPALADRFAYIVALPTFAALSDTDRAAIVRGSGDAPSPDAHIVVRELVEATRDLIHAAPAELHDAAVNYVLALEPRLLLASITIGGRRAATLKRNLIAVWAASQALGRPNHEHAFVSTLMTSLPERVRRPIALAQLIAAHQESWQDVTLPAHDPLRTLLSVQDPLRRATLAVTLPGLTREARGEALCGALGQLPAVDAAIVAWQVLPRLQGGEYTVPATAVETVAELITPYVVGGTVVRGWGSALRWVTFVRTSLSRTALGPEEAEFLCNVICTASPIPAQLSAGFDEFTVRTQIIEPALERWERCSAALGDSHSLRLTGVA
jgi:MoxR-like ATPase